MTTRKSNGWKADLHYLLEHGCIMFAGVEKHNLITPIFPLSFLHLFFFHRCPESIYLWGARSQIQHLHITQETDWDMTLLLYGMDRQRHADKANASKWWGLEATRQKGKEGLYRREVESLLHIYSVALE